MSRRVHLRQASVIGGTRPTYLRNPRDSPAFVISGRQPLTSPRAIRLLHISQTIVQPARPPLPELEFVGNNPIAAPPLGTWYRTIAVGALDALERLFKHVTALDRLALLRRVDAQAAIERARLEIRIRLHGTDALDDTIDAHLPLDGWPEEQQARAACGLHLARLPALIVRVEDVAAIVDPLEQHRSHGGPAVRRRGRQRHRRRIGLGVTDLFEPVRELTHRIGIRVHLAERFAEVLAPDIRERHWLVVGGWEFVATNHQPNVVAFHDDTCNAAFGQRAEEHRFGERLLHLAFDQPRHRPRAKCAIEAFRREPCTSWWIEFDGDTLGGNHRTQLIDLFVDDALDLEGPEGVEVHDRVEAVAELRREHLLERSAR